MKRKLLNIELCSVSSIIPFSMVSLRIPGENTEDIEKRIERQYQEKLSSYCLYDFIKLTGRLNTKIKFVNKNYFDPETNKYTYIVGYESGGFSVFDQEREKIIEVNPNWDISQNFSGDIMSDKHLLVYRETIGDIVISNINVRDKLMIGDRRRAKKKTDSSKINDDWKNKAENTKIEKDVNFDNFTKNHLIKLQKAEKSNFLNLGIREELNGLLYADNEIDHSWIFKVEQKDVFGDNDTEKYINKTSKGICGYITVNQMMLYNEFFLGSGYMTMSETDKYINKKEDFYVDISNPLPSEWRMNEEKAMKYHLKHAMNEFSNDERKEMFIRNNFSPKLNNEYMVDMLNNYPSYINGTTFTTRKIILDGLNKNSKVKYSYKKLDIENKNINEFIKNKKRPLFLISKTKKIESGEYKYRDSYHIYVAYGSYNDGRVLINYNWRGKHTQVILDTSHIIGAEYLEHSGNNELKKYFWNGVEHVTGPEMTNYLKDWEFIK